MEGLKRKARGLLEKFKGDGYAFGFGVLDRVGSMASSLGKRAMVVANASSPWNRSTVSTVMDSLKGAGVGVLDDIVAGARPNAPREDVYRLEGHILHRRPDLLVALGGGSGIDAVKAAAVLAAFGSHGAEIDQWFGVGQVSAAVQRTARRILPILAIQTASSSAAHLTKYSNVTDPAAGQKKLIVDDAIVPPRAVFDYGCTLEMGREFTLDGGMDGISHSLEVIYGAAKAPNYREVREITLTGIELCLAGLLRASRNPKDREGRELLGLGTDLGGYAIMVGGTNGGHLTSFSLVDVLSHGRACMLTNPYYTVFFAPAIEDPLRGVGDILIRHGFIKEKLESLAGRDLGIAVARGLVAVEEAVDFPTTLGQVPGITREHIARALAAAKDPQLESKLKNMPVPLDAAKVDRFMGPILEAAMTGKLEGIKSVD
jgi:alcohol dehydrogenase